jgi:hypothetical protein
MDSPFITGDFTFCMDIQTHGLDIHQGDFSTGHSLRMDAGFYVHFCRRYGGERIAMATIA